MKKIFMLLACLLISLSIASCSNKEKLYLFNWGEYIDNSSTDGVNLIKKFEKEYNCRVKQPNFESNEAAITKMETQSFDIVIPSEYAIEQLALENKIEEIDWTKVEGFSKDDISTPLMEMLEDLNSGDNPFDFLKYAVPYFWGNVGICYNPAKVSLTELETYGWKIFQQAKYRGKVAYYDSSRDGFMVPFKDLGYSMNTTSTDEFNAATNWLNTMKSNVDCVFKTDELLSELPTLTYDLALIYSGDALYCIQQAEELGNSLAYYVPDSGTNVFADGMVIPKNAKNPELAYKFISFMCRPENALANSEYVSYTTSVNVAYIEATSPSGVFANYKNIYSQPYRREVDEIFRYNRDMKVKLNNAWTTFKAK